MFSVPAGKSFKSLNLPTKLKYHLVSAKKDQKDGVKYFLQIILLYNNLYYISISIHIYYYYLLNLNIN